MPTTNTLKADEKTFVSANHQNDTDASLNEHGEIADPVSDVSFDTELAVVSSPALSLQNSMYRKGLMHMPSKMDEWQCFYIDRVRVGMTKLGRKYALYSADGNFYATCEKRKKNKTPHYVVCTDPVATEVDRDHPLFVGKIRSNFFGSDFTAYDLGKNPKELSKTKSHDNSGVPVREELVHISYLVSAFKPGRKIQIVIPTVTYNDGKPYIPCRPLDHDAQGLKALAKERMRDEVVTSFINRPGRWSSSEKCYRIDWEQIRTPILSQRNFQLVRVEDNDEVVFQFGKESGSRYFVDFRAGISPFQALSIAVSMLDYKFCTT